MLQVAVIIPEQPTFKPFINLVSEPGKTEKFFNFSSSKIL